MAIEQGIKFEQPEGETLYKSVLRTEGPATPKAEDYYITDNGSTGTFSWNGADVTIAPMQQIYLPADGPAEVTDLVTGKLYRLIDGGISYRAAAARLILESGGEYFINHTIRGVFNRIAGGFPVGEYGIRNVVTTGGAYLHFGKNLDGEIFELPFQPGAQFYNSSNGRRMFYSGDGIIPIDEPWDVGNVIIRNIDFDTVTKQDLYEAMDEINGVTPLRSASDRIKRRVLLAGQDDAIQNGFYDVEIDTDLRILTRLVPMPQSNRAIADLSLSFRVSSGDKYGQKLVSFRNKTTLLTAGNVAIHRVGTHELELVSQSASAADIVSLIARVNSLEMIEAPDLTDLTNRIEVIENLDYATRAELQALANIGTGIKRSVDPPDLTADWDLWIQDGAIEKGTYTWYTLANQKYLRQLDGGTVAEPDQPAIVGALDKTAYELGETLVMTFNLIDANGIDNVVWNIQQNGYSLTTYSANVIEGVATAQYLITNTGDLTVNGRGENSEGDDLILAPIPFTVVRPAPATGDFLLDHEHFDFRVSLNTLDQQVAPIIDEDLTILVPTGAPTGKDFHLIAEGAREGAQFRVSALNCSVAIAAVGQVADIQDISIISASIPDRVSDTIGIIQVASPAETTLQMDHPPGLMVVTLMSVGPIGGKIIIVPISNGPEVTT